MSDIKTDGIVVSPRAGEPRKPYRTPKLRSYGDIRVLTQKGSSRAGSIDSSGKADKTNG
ncbi:MAG: hypothetical protein AB7Q29_02290 [Vicinamibacterales bacterium]